MAAVRALTAPLRAVRSARIDFHDPVASLGDRGRHPGQHGPGGRLGVDRVRLAPLAAGPTVGSVDLDHGYALVQEHLGQSGAVAAGAFHPDRTQLPMAM